jgi:drug/metabolite transporter superfamily protein YnfA
MGRGARMLVRTLKESSLVIVHVACFLQVYTVGQEFAYLDLPYTCFTTTGICPDELTRSFTSSANEGELMSERYADRMKREGTLVYTGRMLRDLFVNNSAWIGMTIPSAFMLIWNLVLYTHAARTTLSDTETCFQVHRFLRRRCAHVIRALHIVILCFFVFLSTIIYLSLNGRGTDPNGGAGLSVDAGRLYANPSVLGGFVVNVAVPAFLFLKSFAWWRQIDSTIPSADGVSTQRKRLDEALAAKGSKALEAIPPFVSFGCSSGMSQGLANGFIASKSDPCGVHAPFLLLGLLPGGLSIYSARSVVFAEEEKLCRGVAALCGAPVSEAEASGSFAHVRSRSRRRRTVLLLRWLRQMLAAATVCVGLNTAIATLNRNTSTASVTLPPSVSSAAPWSPPPLKPPSPPPWNVCTDGCLSATCDACMSADCAERAQSPDLDHHKCSSGQYYKVTSSDSNGECNDGGPGSAHSDCELGAGMAT